MKTADLVHAEQLPFQYTTASETISLLFVLGVNVLLAHCKPFNNEGSRKVRAFQQFPTLSTVSGYSDPTKQKSRPSSIRKSLSFSSNARCRSASA